MLNENARGQEQKLRQIAFATAYRIVGNAADAEDIAQNTIIKFLAHKNSVKTESSFVATISARLSLNLLRDAKRRDKKHQNYGLPVPIFKDEFLNVDARIDLAFGLSVLTLQLPPLARAVFILRNAFDLSYDEISNALNASPTACRKAYSRATNNIGIPSEFDARYFENEFALRRMTDCISNGKLHELIGLLAEDIVLYSDGGKSAPAFNIPIRGRIRIAEFLIKSPALFSMLGENTSQITYRFLPSNGNMTLVVVSENKVILCVVVMCEKKGISEIFAISDHEKLSRHGIPDLDNF